MANAEKPEEELSGYESESDDRVPPLTMRRREASDDEDGEDSGVSDDGEKRFGADRTVVVCSDGESSDADGLGGAPSESDGEEESSTDHEDESVEYGEAGIVERHFGAESTVGACSDGFDGAPPESDGESCTDEGNAFEEVEEGVETAPVRQVVEKKECTEPYVIPTVGAFYMHDDRFRNNGGRRRNSQKPGGRNLWKFKDESKWVHDKFEELTLQDTHSKEEDITTKGRNQVRSINHGGDIYSNGEKFRRNVKGRGPVKYKPMAGRNNLNLHAKDHLYLEKKSNTTSARVHFSDVQSNHLSSRPSSMLSTYNAEYSQSRVQRGLPSARYQSMPFLNEFYRASSRAQQPLIQQRPVKSIFQPSLQSSTGHWGLSYASGTQASRIAFSPYSFECGDLESLLGPGPSISQFAPDGNQCITQGSGTSSITYDGTQFDQNYPATPFPKSLLGPRPSITQFTPAGNRGGITQGSGTSSSLYGGTHFDQNYPATPFPVVHFGGQHHGDLGYAGYAFQSLPGFGNSDITWRQTLNLRVAGTAGDLVLTYHSAHSSVDGGYDARPPGRTSSIGVSINERRAKEITGGNKTPYKPELVNEEYRQQQIKPRRYSKMNLQQVK